MILLTILIYIIYILFFNNNAYLVSCNSDNPSCKMYNHRDITSKCNSMCSVKNPNYIFNDNHTYKNGIHTCECIVKETFINERKIKDQDQTEKFEEQRLHTLIFGN